MISWLKKNRYEILVVLFLITVASFLRFYRLADYMTFLGDEGRDALMVKRILVDHDFPLLGPPTSVGTFYLGPLYYYMMALSMAISWLNPVAATAMVAMIGVATVGLIYYLAKSWFGVFPAIISSILYAVSPVTITYSRSSWNPNPAPFFALLAVLGIYKAHQKNNYMWLMLTGAALAAAIQMHYLALILLPIFGAFWLKEALNKKKHAISSRFILGTFSAFIIFFLLTSPLIIFDFKYNFVNFRAFQAFFFQGDGGFNLLSAISKILPTYQYSLIGRYIGAENFIVSLLLSALVLIPLFIGLTAKIKGRKVEYGYWLLGVWLIVGMVGISFYKGAVYDHYLGFVNPAPFLLLGAVINYLNSKKSRVLQLLIIIGLGFLVFLNLQKNPLRLESNKQFATTREISKFVIADAGNKPFNFALISKNNYDSAYQFFLDAYGFKPKVVPVEVTDQLFVVCEDQVCNPINHPKYEIAGFGMAKIEKVDSVMGVKIFKLVPNPLGK